MGDRLRAVLFDSCGVLMRLIDGRWNPGPDFEETVLSYDPTVTEARFAAAVEAGDRFLAMYTVPPGRDDYHRHLLHHLSLDPTPDLLADLRRELPSATSLLELYPEVVPTLRELRRRGVRMAVVSDAWAELPYIHAQLGLGGFFEAYAVSETLGCVKPDPRMYRHASEALELRPGECLFVDDHAELVTAAIELGYAGRVVCRDGEPAGTGVPSIGELTELLALF